MMKYKILSYTPSPCSTTRYHDWHVFEHSFPRTNLNLYPNARGVYFSVCKAVVQPL